MPVIVKPIEAVLSRNTDTIGKMDPYVEFTIGKETRKSSVHNEGGKNPRWNDVIHFNERSDKLLVTIMDKDLTSSDLVGTGEFVISSAYKYPGQEARFPIEIFFEKQYIGKLMVSVEYRA